MKCERLLFCIEDIKEKYISGNKRTEKEKRILPKDNIMVKIGISILACIGLLIMRNSFLNQQQDTLVTDGSDRTLDEPENNLIISNENVFPVAADTININEIKEMIPSDSGPSFSQREMNWKNICDYYGIDFAMTYLPRRLFR